MEGLSRLIRTLADKTRLRILRLLAKGERDVGGMQTALHVPQPSVSYHLASMRTMQLVTSRRAGQHVFYTLGRSARAEPNGSLSLLTGDTVVNIRSDG
jgi:DNA-binding transcriptional ArsR family regulator